MGMHPIDYALIGLYAAALIAVAIRCSIGNITDEDYYLGGRKIGGGHLGLSVAATDVGGGFSIGLGALGFSTGLSGSWLLFTGLIGALWSASVLIPFLKRLPNHDSFLSFPQVFLEKYGKGAALIAALISMIGYLGFTSSQLIAGTKLSSAIFPEFSFDSILICLSFVTIVYTAIGGLKAVVYTDSIQWIIVLIGLAGFAIPFTLYEIGGWSGLLAHLPQGHLSLTAIGWKQFLNWMVSIVPIWFVAMTLYQRIFACADEKTAKKAWLVAGLFEWPVMAFLGAFLGVMAQAAMNEGLLTQFATGLATDSELAIPVLLVNILPTGILGIVFASYISAVLSTADSCLMAASGNLSEDLMPRSLRKHFGSVRVTFLLGVVALVIAMSFENVLGLMLYSYSFMISGLFVPVLAMIYMRRPSQLAAIVSMLVGGSVCIAVGASSPWGLDANFFGIAAAALSFGIVNFLAPSREARNWSQD